MLLIEASELQALFKAISDNKLSVMEAVDRINNQIVDSDISIPEDIILAVDYRREFVQMIEDGRYDDVDANISEENFYYPNDLRNKVSIISVKLFHFNEEKSAETAVFEINSNGYRPATLFELLTLGAKRPSLQRHFPIVALGSSWYPPDDRFVPYLTIDKYERLLKLCRYTAISGSMFRFMAVKKG